MVPNVGRNGVFAVWAKQLKNSNAKTCLAMMVGALCSFKTSVTIHPTPQHNATQDYNLQQHCYDKLNYQADFIITKKPNSNLLYYITPNHTYFKFCCHKISCTSIKYITITDK
jgi:hypothetical protein